jgi:hypothetical protein
MKKFLMACVLAVVGFNASASQSWPQEPDSLLGIKLHQRLPSFPSCNKAANKQQLCVAMNANDAVVLLNGPDLGFEHVVYVQLYHGVVSMVAVRAKGDNAKELETMAKYKYGNPQTSKLFSAEWVGDRTVVELMQQPFEDYTYSVALMDKALLSEMNKEHEQAMHSKASNF